MGKKRAKLVDKLTKQERDKVKLALEPEAFISVLKRGRITTEQLCKRLNATEPQVMDAISNCQGHGYLLYKFGEEWSLEKAPPATPNVLDYTSRKNSTYKFGFSADQHLCSKYERLDVLNSLYDHFKEQKVDRVLNAGNWIDGEARFNKHDLTVHGMDTQIEYLCQNYPERKGVSTYAVAGDDHEGWYGQREGIDIGKHTEDIMRRYKRNDWFNVGYMEAFFRLVNANTGKHSHLLLMHPGGGSSYADSYRPQKIVESLAGGEKPAVIVGGHYHKMGYYPIRNVHFIQSGCTQDQTPFMRKKGLQAHVGGGICELTQDPLTGAIIGCKVQFFTYYNEGYYNTRWNHGSDVTLAYRGV